MKDRYNRTIDYLRISVTDRCNLRCVYCMPETGVPSMDHNDILTYEEIIQIAAVAKRLGVNHVRITGGEPLVRKDITHLIQRLSQLKYLDISMTTNGVLLGSMAKALKQAGLDRVNISLDTLSANKFAQITRRDKLQEVISGIDSALSAGLEPVKINTVVTDFNFGEIKDIASLVHKRPLHVRFIEVMPIGPDDTQKDMYISVDQIKTEVSKLGCLRPLPRKRSQHGLRGAGPAQTFELAGAQGTIGFISAMSDPFCDHCNRLRLTADGKILPCLAHDLSVDLIPILRNTHSENNTEKLLEYAFNLATRLKPKAHQLDKCHPNKKRMCQIGG